MTYSQQIHDCPDHPECTVIVCVDDDTSSMVWESHDHVSVDPAERINPDHPAEDHRGNPASPPTIKSRPARSSP